MQYYMLFVLNLCILLQAYSQPAEGIWLYQKGLYKQALRYWDEQLMQATAGQDTLYLWKARCHYAIGELEPSWQATEQALRSNPALAEAHALQAEIAMDRQQWQTAMQSWEKALLLRPHPAKWKTAWIYCIAAEGDQARALRLLEQMTIENGQDSTYLWHLQARLHLLGQNYKAAVELYTQLLSRQVGHFEWLLERGIAHYNMQRYHAALTDLKAAAAFRPSHPKPAYYQALCYYQSGAYTLAFQQTEYALIHGPASADLLLLRANIARQTQQATWIEQAYKQLAEQKTYTASAYTGLAEYYLQQQQNKKALATVDSCLNRAPDYLPAIAIRIILLHQAKQYAHAELLEQYYLQLAKHAEDYYNLARLHLYYLPTHPRIIQWAEQAVQLKDNYAHNLLLAQALYQHQLHTRAYAICLKAIDIAKKEHRSPQEAINLKKQLDELHIDDTPPVIDLSSPQSTQGVIRATAYSLYIIGQVHDETQVAGLYINQQPIYFDQQGNFHHIYHMQQLPDTLTLLAEDIHGNQQQIRYPILPAADLMPKADTKAKYRALLFASNRYEHWQDLINPIADAQALAKVLNQIYRFDTDLVINATKEQILLKIKEYILKTYQNGDQLLIFFAGHGQYDELFGEGYLVTTDSKTDDETKSSYLAYSTLRTYINSIPCPHILLVMDACFAGTFDPQLAQARHRGAKSTITDRETFIRQQQQAKTRRYITSGGKEYVSDGLPGQHSPFVRQLLEALHSRGGEDGILTLNELMSYLQHVNPKPHAGEFGSNEPGSDFLFISH